MNKVVMFTPEVRKDKTIIPKGNRIPANNQGIVVTLTLLKYMIECNPFHPYNLAVTNTAAMVPPYCASKLLSFNCDSGKSNEKSGNRMCTTSTTIGFSTWVIRNVSNTKEIMGNLSIRLFFIMFGSLEFAFNSPYNSPIYAIPGAVLGTIKYAKEYT